jgi:hypothetical protein
MARFAAMNPEELRHQSSLSDVPILLAGQDSFCVSYVAGALAKTGARILGPFASEAEALASFRTAPEAPRVAVLAEAFADGGSSGIAACLSAAGIPFVFVQERAGKCELRGFTGRRFFEQPFGAFQVIEGLALLASPDD